MADFAHWLHIRPWEIGDLTVEEFEHCCSVIDQIGKIGGNSNG